MNLARTLVALVCAIALCAAAPAAAAPQLKVGIYDCMAYNYSTGFLDYKGSVKIKARHRYEHAFGRTKRTLEDKTQGTFKRRGALLIFKKGALDDTKAKLERGTGDKHEPFFNLLLDGEPSGISCYFVAKP